MYQIMNNSLSSLIAFNWLYFLVWVSYLPLYLQAQTLDNATEVVTIPINTDRSIIMWKGTEMWQSGKHEGTLNLSKGYLLFEDDQLIGGQFVADMNSIAITDIPKHDPIPRRNLRNHLKSEDFFYVEEYPKARFEITKTEEFKSDSLRVWGDLSIRDITQSISFIASKKSDQNSVLAFDATFKIDRFAWNISYQGSYWDRMTSILDNTLVDADIYLSVRLITLSLE